jgi:hypothetical protein
VDDLVGARWVPKQAGNRTGLPLPTIPGPDGTLPLPHIGLIFKLRPIYLNALKNFMLKL